MVGTDTNNDQRSFWRADVEEAANRLAKILEEESADVLTIYDEHGGYSHPDHIQVYRVGKRAAEIAATPRVYEATLNRDHFVRLLRAAKDAGLDLPDMPEPDEFADFGMPEDQITTTVDVSAYLETKRRAMAAHASQIGPESMFMTMPEAVFTATWGTEWFIRAGAPPGLGETSLFS
jgi:LmbE family N-acetylglucosaminyl deacetylase